MPENTKRLGLAALIAAVLLPAAQVMTPVVGDIINKRNELAANATIESEKRRIEVTRLLFENYFGKPAEQQAATVDYLVALFPKELKDLQPLLISRAADNAVVSKVDAAVATTTDVSVSEAESAAQLEREGFQAIIAGDLPSARKYFGTAYSLFPTYHQVDEIYRRVLTEDLISAFERGSAADRESLHQQVLRALRDDYSWGIPADLKQQIRDEANNPAQP